MISIIFLQFIIFLVQKCQIINLFDASEIS